MLKISNIVSQIDSFVWGPVMLVLLVGTGVLLTVRCNFLTWRNLPWALKKTLSKEARTKSRGTGDVSPFSALTTALAATIGTGNIVGAQVEVSSIADMTRAFEMDINKMMGKTIMIWNK